MRVRVSLRAHAVDLGLVERRRDVLIQPPLSRLRLREVEEVFEVPLSFILDPKNHHRQGRVFYGAMSYFYVLPYQNQYIWGATAGMLVNLYQILEGQNTLGKIIKD